MGRLNKLALLEKCVDSREQYEDLIGPLFPEFNLLYQSLSKADTKIEDIKKITYKKIAQNIEFTISSTKENDSTDAKGVTLRFPVSGGGY